MWPQIFGGMERISIVVEMVGLPLIRAHVHMGWGHDATRILAALDEKANRYGPLDARWSLLC